MEIIQVLTNDNSLLREEKSIKGLSLQRVASATTKEPIQLCQKKIFSAAREFKFALNVTLEKNIGFLREMSYNFSNLSRPNWSGFIQVYSKGTFQK